MADNGRLSLLPEVATLFEQFKQAVESTVTVVVTSAYPLSDDETRVLSETMTSKLHQIKLHRLLICLLR